MKRPEPPPGLAESILRATTGPTCDAARERICDWVDGTLGDLDDELVRLHAASCPDCARLADVLRAMGEDLPMLAEIDPGPAFTAAVLAATEAMRPVPLAARIAEAWQRMIQRPRIAWEGAYIGGFVLVLLFGTPGSPFASVPQRALAIAALNPVEEIREPVSRIEDSVTWEIQSAWSSTRWKVTTRSEKVVGKIRGRISGLLESIGRADESSAGGKETEPSAGAARHSDSEQTETDDPNAPERIERDRPDGETR